MAGQNAGQSTSQRRIHLRLLGAPSWQVLGDPCDAAGPVSLAPRDAGLLALLAIDGSVSRDRVAAWLWPDASDQARANLSLRQRLFRLRRECGHTLVDTGPQLRLAQGVSVDLHAQPVPTDAALLAGMDFGGLEALSTWVDAAREVLGRRQADVLAGRAEVLESEGRLGDAVRLCERIVAAWPASEQAWRHLMHLHWQRADRAAAVASFERFEQQVCREWGLRPSAQTLALLARIEAEEPSARIDPPDAGAGTGAGAALRPRGRLDRPPRLIGRDQALASMVDAWAQQRAVLVLAPGGMGKTRLLQALAGTRPRARLVVEVRARPGDADRPFATLARGLDAALSQCAAVLSPSDAQVLSALVTRLGPAPSHPLAWPQLLAASTAAWLAAIDQGLDALVWDDMHWSDPASVELLQSQLVEPALGALRLAFAARPDERTPAADLLARWLGDSLRVQPVRLRSWTLADLQALLPTLNLPAALAGDGALAARLLRLTGGQPFFVLESLKTLVQADGQAPSAGTAPSVAAMIERRMTGLPAPALRLLHLRAVHTGELTLPVAAAVLKRTPMALADDWAALAGAQLVNAHGDVHDLVREAVLATMPMPAQAALQLALAQVLAQQPGTDPARLAALWQAGQVWPEAARASCRAAEAAVPTGRMAEAQALFEQALAAGRHSGDPDLLARLTQAACPTLLLRLGADDVAARLRDQLAGLADGPARARLLLLLGEAELSRMQPQAAHAASAEAMAWCDARALAATDDAADDADLAADAAVLHGRTLAWVGQADIGIGLLQAAQERATSQGSLRQRLRIQATLADVLVAAGRRGESARLQTGTLALARQLHDRLEVAVAASNLAVYSLLIGDADQALAAAREALTGFAEMGVAHVNRPMCAGVHAMAAAHAGDFAAALAQALPLLGAPGQPPADPVRRNLQTTVAQLAMWRGRFDEAWRLLPGTDDDWPLAIRVTGLLARLRHAAWTGRDPAADVAALQDLGLAHPGLRNDPHYYRNWAQWDDAEAAIDRLDRLARQEAAAGAPGNARALQLAALQRRLLQAGVNVHACANLRNIDSLPGLDALPDMAQRASALRAMPERPLPPTLMPTEAAWALATGLLVAGDTAAASAVVQPALRWLQQVRLPASDGPFEAAMHQLHQHQPVHRALARLAALLPAAPG